MLEMLDTGGQEEYTPLRDQWIRNGEGFIIVYSITSRASFSRIPMVHNEIQRVKGSTASSPLYTSSPPSSCKPLSSVPVVLVGNKSDKTTEREVSTHEGRALAQKLGCKFLEASAKNCMGVEDPFYDVVRQLQRQLIPTTVRQTQRTRMRSRMGISDGTTSREGYIYRSRKGRLHDFIRMAGFRALSTTRPHGPNL
jgi:GTPase KRas protein